MSRESEFRHKYGVFGAGPVSRSLIGSLAAHTQQLGPVAAVSFRVASRLANSLKNGYAVRDAADLRNAPVILFHAPPDQVDAQLAILRQASLDWTGRSLILCNCQANPEIPPLFCAKGASVATIRDFGVTGFVAIHGSAEAGTCRATSQATSQAMKTALRIARTLHLRVVEIVGSGDRQFDAAITLSTAAITPLIHWAASLLRSAGAREGDAAGLAATLVERTARSYSHSGRQSWEWYAQAPDALSLRQQIAGSGKAFEPIFRDLLLLGFELFSRHQELAVAIEPGPENTSPGPPARHSE
jgi:hypothetical protein